MSVGVHFVLGFARLFSHGVHFEQSALRFAYTCNVYGPIVDAKPHGK